MVETSQPLCRESNGPPSTQLLCGFTLGALMIMGHFQAGPPEAALDVEPLVVFAAVENRLVAARLLRDVVERLDEAETQLLALLVFGDGDVLDVSDGPEIVDARRYDPMLALPI